MSKPVVVTSTGSIGVVGLLWVLLLFTKMMGLSPMSWLFTICFPLVWVACLIAFFVACGCIAWGINWLAKRG